MKSTEFSVKDAKNELLKLKTKAEIIDFCDEDERKTVLSAAELQIGLLSDAEPKEEVNEVEAPKQEKEEVVKEATAFDKAKEDVVKAAKAYSDALGVCIKEANKAGQKGRTFYRTKREIDYKISKVISKIV